VKEQHGKRSLRTAKQQHEEQEGQQQQEDNRLAVCN
jgi:hypothetical protein